MNAMYVLELTEVGEKDAVVVFFFQAEDGIRDLIVTGVQTCALPIYRRGRPAVVGPAALAAHRGRPALSLHQLDAGDGGGRNREERRRLRGEGRGRATLDHPQVAGERRQEYHQERGAAGRHAKRLRRAMASATAPMNALGATTTPPKA